MGKLRMNETKIPALSKEEIVQHFRNAVSSIRKRSHKILHEKGDYLNKVFNFILDDSYMHPHLHPGVEKIEKMHLIQGSFALVIFDENGGVKETIVLEKGGKEYVTVPAFTWHTYVMLTKEVIVYETMEGVYDPATWKEMASWAPAENTEDAVPFLEMLKKKATS
jgi:cupin fold WbuC family metalloprotein